MTIAAPKATTRSQRGHNNDNVPLKEFALPESAPDAPAQLHTLTDDPGETASLYHQHPETMRA
jgi:hypothetical protein